GGAARGEAKERKSMPSRLRAFSKTQRMERSSSTIQTGVIVALSRRRSIERSVERQQNPERGPAGPTFAFDHSLMELHVGLGKREPYAAAALAPGHQRAEDSVADRRRNPRSVVYHLQIQCQAITLALDR